MTPAFAHHNLSVYCGDALTVLRSMPDESVQCCVTSPPYWGLRNYGVEGQLGLEKTPAEYVAKMVEVFREVRRVLKNDGTCWVNLGDTYASAWACNRRSQVGSGSPKLEERMDRLGGLKEKDLVGIPWRFAFGVQDDGWWLRSDIIWDKPNCMPESVRDRPTRAHEYLFLLTKKERYYYDADAIKEPCTESTVERLSQDVENQIGSLRANGGAKTNGTMKAVGKIDKQRGHSRRHDGFNDRWDKMERSEQCSGFRNKRDVWRIAPATYSDAHFAVMPAELANPCILAGSKPGDTILDPFGGSGTTAQVALETGRKAVLIELNPEYVELIKRRTDITPGLLLA